MLRWAGAMAAVALVAACGDTMAATSHPRAITQLLTVDQLVAPDFTADVAAHTISVADVAALEGGSTSALTSGGFIDAAQVDFFRQDGDLAHLNGPIEVQDTSIAFTAAAGAESTFTAEAAHLDHDSGATAVSTGALGDGAHATQRTATVQGVDAVEFTVAWRVGTLLNVLVVRGRAGGVRITDALLLAHTQTVTEEQPASPAA